MKLPGISSFEYILFDLDDTLYPKEAGVMAALSERMLQFMVHRLGLPADDVAAKRREYYQKYGTTLRGLMEEHRIDPAEYLAYVHNINLRNFIGVNPPLNQMLAEIPLEKAIFTNADTAHAHRVLDVLQVRHHFSRIIDIKTVGYKNKPDPRAYRHVLDLLQVPGSACIMVEDSPRNLLPAKDLGMTTILVDGTSPGNKAFLGIDYLVPTVFHVGQIIKTILPMRGIS